MILFYLCHLVPGILRGIKYTPSSPSKLSVAVPLQQDLSIARGVITLYHSSIVRYDDSTIRDNDSYMTGFIDGSYCIDDDDLSNATGDDLHIFTFTQLGKTMYMYECLCEYMRI